MTLNNFADLLASDSAAPGAWLNIMINIGGINDKSFTTKYRLQGKAILGKALTLADKIYAAILESL